MKKTHILLVIFALLGGGSWLFLKKDKKQSNKALDLKFGIENVDEIHKIFLADRKGKTIKLERQTDYWLLNGRWKANRSIMENLLETTQKVRIKYVPAAVAVDNIVKNLAAYGIKVEIYDQQNKKIKSYYVGGASNDETATYLIMDGSNKPYAAYIPGFVGNIRTRYITNEQDWRDKTIFAEKMQDIDTLTVQYPQQKSSSFKLFRKNDDFEIIPFYETTSIIHKPVNKGATHAYLQGYKRLLAEAFNNEYSKRDSIEQQVPFCIISMKKTNGTEKEVKFFPIVNKNKNGRPMRDNKGKAIIERYHAVVNGEDLMLAQDLLFNKIFWGYQQFFDYKK